MSGEQQNSSLRFIYQNAKGEVSERELYAWRESGLYILSFDPFRSFLKERIVEYLEGLDLVVDPNPPAVPRPIRNSKPKGPQDDRPQMLFTGFLSKRRTELEAAADVGGVRVVKSVTAGLQYLVCGPNAGPKKIEKARDQGVILLDEEQMLWLLETGELPD